MVEEGIVRCVLDEQEFQGEGKKKADAKRDAAANALAFLQQQPLWEAQQRLPPLNEVLNACFTNQVGWKGAFGGFFGLMGGWCRRGSNHRPPASSH